MKIKRIFTVILMLFLSISCAKNSVNACSCQTLTADIFDMCQKYDVGFCYKNPSNGEVLGYNSKKKYDPASTNKTCLAICVFDMLKNGKINLNDTVEYKSYHKYGGTGIIQYEEFGKRYTIEQLLKLLITHSDNVAFRMLMMEVATEPYLKEFLAPFGIIIETERLSLQSFSAEDLVLHLEILYRYMSNGTALAKMIKSFYSSGIYNDKIPAGVPNLTVFHKPGWIPSKLICADEAIIFDENNQPYFSAIMSQGIPQEKQAEFFQALTAKINEYHNCLGQKHEDSN